MVEIDSALTNDELAEAIDYAYQHSDYMTVHGSLMADHLKALLEIQQVRASFFVIKGEENGV